MKQVAFPFIGILAIAFSHALEISRAAETNGAPEMNRSPKYELRAKSLALKLSANGEIVGATINGFQTALSGATEIGECIQIGPAKAEKVFFGSDVKFTRTLRHVPSGRMLTVVDRFKSSGESVRWEMEITSDGEPWTAAIDTRLNYPATEKSRFWTSWGDPDDRPGIWQDPLVWRPFAGRSWFYQFSLWSEVLNGQRPAQICLPLVTMGEPTEDAALTFAQSPEDVLLDLKLAVTKQGEITLARTHYRLGEGRAVHFAMDLAAYPADCRAGLGWVVKRYPAFFNPPNPAADAMAGCGAYSGNEEHFDVEKLRKMAFRINWKCSEDFPYMGLFLPPMATAQARWDRAPDENTPGKPAWTSYQTLNDYSHWMRTHGFHVLNYFNAFEYGRNMQFPPPPRRAKSETDLWKDPHDYLFQSDRRSAVVMKGGQPLRSNCYGALIVDPGDPAYQRHLLEQARRHIEKLPDSDGICIDRTDWLGSCNQEADDGVSWVDGKPARSLSVSWKDLMSKLGPLMHQAGKVIFINNCTVRLETLREVDGIYSEWTSGSPSYDNYAALEGVRKPVMIWTADDKELDDAYFQRCLYLGVFPTAPYPNNNHCLRPSAHADKMFLDYGPLLDAMRGKKWVLAPHCVQVADDAAKVNLFQVPGGYAMPVTFGGNSEFADVVVRTIPGLGAIECSAIHPGAETAAPLAATVKDGALTLRVPLRRGCAMVLLRKKG